MHKIDKILREHNVNATRYEFYSEVGKVDRDILLAHSEEFVRALYTSVFSFSSYRGDLIDAGANSGNHTRSLALMAKASGHRVIAVEPNANLHSTIRSVCTAEMCDNLTIDARAMFGVSAEDVDFIHCVSDEQLSQIVHPDVPNYDRVIEDTAVDSYFAGQEIRKTTISTVSLEDLVSEYDVSPAFIKLDIEQCEYSVLKNSTDLLNRQRPVLSVEVAPWSVPAGKMSALYELADQLDYIWCDFLGLPFDLESWEREDCFLYWNRFLVPIEKAAILEHYQSGARHLVGSLLGQSDWDAELKAVQTAVVKDLAELGELSENASRDREAEAQLKKKLQTSRPVLVIGDLADNFDLRNGEAPHFQFSHMKSLFQCADYLARGHEVIFSCIEGKKKWLVTSLFPIVNVQSLDGIDIRELECEACVSVWPSAFIEHDWMPKYRKGIFILTAVQLFENPDYFTPSTLAIYRSALSSKVDYVLTNNDRMKEIALALFSWIAQWKFEERILVGKVGYAEKEIDDELTGTIAEIRADMGLASGQIGIVNAGGVWSWTDLDVFLRGFTKAVRQGATNLTFFIMGMKQDENEDHREFIDDINGILDDNRDLVEAGNIRVIKDWREASKKLRSWKYGADLGINVSKISVENYQSHRIRFVEYTKAGIPVINTLGDSISDDPEWKEALYTVNAGDEESYVSALLEVSRDSDLLTRKKKKMGELRSQFNLTNGLLRTVQEAVEGKPIAAKVRKGMMQGVDEEIVATTRMLFPATALGISTSDRGEESPAGFGRSVNMLDDLAKKTDRRFDELLERMDSRFNYAEEKVLSISHDLNTVTDRTSQTNRMVSRMPSSLALRVIAKIRNFLR